MLTQTEFNTIAQTLEAEKQTNCRMRLDSRPLALSTACCDTSIFGICVFGFLVFLRAWLPYVDDLCRSCKRRTKYNTLSWMAVDFTIQQWESPCDLEQIVFFSFKVRGRARMCALHAFICQCPGVPSYRRKKGGGKEMSHQTGVWRGHFRHWWTGWRMPRGPGASVKGSSPQVSGVSGKVYSQCG